VIGRDAPSSGIGRLSITRLVRFFLSLIRPSALFRSTCA
jgi:hypothetical protein